MKLLLFCCLTALLLLLSGCDDGYQYWDVSKFTLKPEALDNNEKIKLIYTSRGPSSTHNKNFINKIEKDTQTTSTDAPVYFTNSDYYEHLIGISIATGDTINILSRAYYNITPADTETAFKFIKSNDLVTQTLSLKEVSKVARDPKFDFIADNNYPTVFGDIQRVSD